MDYSAEAVWERTADLDPRSQSVRIPFIVFDQMSREMDHDLWEEVRTILRFQESYSTRRPDQRKLIPDVLIEMARAHSQGLSYAEIMSLPALAGVPCLRDGIYRGRDFCLWAMQRALTPRELASFEYQITQAGGEISSRYQPPERVDLMLDQMRRIPDVILADEELYELSQRLPYLVEVLQLLAEGYDIGTINGMYGLQVADPQIKDIRRQLYDLARGRSEKFFIVRMAENIALDRVRGGTNYRGSPISRKVVTACRELFSSPVRDILRQMDDGTNGVMSNESYLRNLRSFFRYAVFLSLDARYGFEVGVERASFFDAIGDEDNHIVAFISDHYGEYKELPLGIIGLLLQRDQWIPDWLLDGLYGIETLKQAICSGRRFMLNIYLHDNKGVNWEQLIETPTTTAYRFVRRLQGKLVQAAA